MKTFKEIRNITEVSKYDIRDFNWPTVKFTSSSYANDAVNAFEKKLRWKPDDSWFSQNGSKIEFSTYKLKENEAIAAFKKALNIDLTKIR